MNPRARTALTVVVVLAIVGVPLVALFASGGGDDGGGEESSPVLRLERGSAELLVYVEPATNEPDAAGGARSVRLTCVDGDGRLVAAQDEAWPFGDTDGGTLDPHAHVPLDPGRMSQVARCRLDGTEPLLEGILR